jgi:Phosphotransferase enzyme family
VDEILKAAPPGLREALAARGGSVEKAWREGPRAYLPADSPEGPLFARYSSAEEDVAVLGYEAQVRALVGESGPLRAPAVLGHGAGWLLERRIVPTEEPVEVVVAAAAEIAALRLPAAPSASPVRWGSLEPLQRRLRLLGRPRLAVELLRARRLQTRSKLPEVTIHGDLHRGNVLLAEGAAWVVDWELAGRGPAGLDLMRYWATLERPDDRERLFAAAAELVGDELELVRLRYAIAVVTAADMLAHPRSPSRDPVGAASLLLLLPELRRAARL